MFFQSIQNGGSVSVFIACVEGKVQNLIFCILGIIGIKLIQFLDGGVAHGRSSFLLEAESPISLCRSSYRYIVVLA